MLIHMRIYVCTSLVCPFLQDYTLKDIFYGLVLYYYTCHLLGFVAHYTLKWYSLRSMLQSFTQLMSTSLPIPLYPSPLTDNLVPLEVIVKIMIFLFDHIKQVNDRSRHWSWPVYFFFHPYFSLTISIFFTFKTKTEY